MRRLAALALAALATACGQNPTELTNAGRTALESADPAAAEAHFRDALAAYGSDHTSPDYLNARVGLCEALAAQEAAAKAQAAVDEFRKLATEMPDKIDARLYNSLGGRLADAGHRKEAIDLIGAGKERFPDTEHLDKLAHRILEEAEASNDAGALDALKGLGYVGD